MVSFFTPTVAANGVIFFPRSNLQVLWLFFKAPLEQEPSCCPRHTRPTLLFQILTVYCCCTTIQGLGLSWRFNLYCLVIWRQYAMLHYQTHSSVCCCCHNPHCRWIVHCIALLWTMVSSLFQGYDLDQEHILQWLHGFTPCSINSQASLLGGTAPLCSDCS